MPMGVMPQYGMPMYMPSQVDTLSLSLPRAPPNLLLTHTLNVSLSHRLTHSHPLDFFIFYESDGDGP